MDWIAFLSTAAGGGTIATVVTWVLARKKNRAEAEGVEIVNVQKSLEIFNKDIVEPLRQELQNTREELKQARAEIEQLRTELETLHLENQQLRREIHRD